MSINVVIVESDEQFLSCLVRPFASTEEFRCCGLYSKAVNGLKEFHKSLPDVVLIDINLPGANGVKYVRRIKEAHPCLHILVLTHLDNSQTIFDTLSSGASGYLLKASSAKEILTAVREVYHGGSPLTGCTARKLVNLLQQAAMPRQSCRSLSLREQQVLKLLANGLPYKEIATELRIGYATVHTHVRHIYKKLQVYCRTDAVTLYLREHPNWQFQKPVQQPKKIELFSGSAASGNLIGALSC